MLIGMHVKQVDALADQHPARSAPKVKGDPPTSYYVYVPQPACGNVTPGNTEGNSCEHAEKKSRGGSAKCGNPIGCQRR